MAILSCRTLERKPNTKYLGKLPGPFQLFGDKYSLRVSLLASSIENVFSKSSLYRRSIVTFMLYSPYHIINCTRFIILISRSWYAEFCLYHMSAMLI